MSARAPKQWCLTKCETVTSFESWKENITYVLSLDQNFALYLSATSSWLKKTKLNPLRGLTDDGAAVTRNPLTAHQKLAHLELMLGQIANFCPIIARDTIIKKSTSLNSVWSSIRSHFGFQLTGSHFLDFASIKQEHDERPEDLFQRITSFTDSCLLKTECTITHHGELITEDEEITPTLENFTVLTWLRLIHPELPKLIKLRYGTELRSRTLASIKPEISLAMDSLLEELRNTDSIKVFRSSHDRQSNYKPMYKPMYKPSQPVKSTSFKKSCPLCKASGKNDSHFLSQCKYLPENDKKFLTRARSISALLENEDLSENENYDNFLETSDPINNDLCEFSSVRHVRVNQSPYVYAYYSHHPLRLTIDSGAETNMMKESIAIALGCPIEKSSQIACQADGVTLLKVTGEVHLTLSRNNIEMYLDALIVSELDVDVLAGTPFMTTNDVSVRPAKCLITIKEQESFYYGKSNKSNNTHSIRRAHILRSPSATTTLWPGEFLELSIPEEITPDSLIAIEPHYNTDNYKSNNWLKSDIVSSVGGFVRLVNSTNESYTLKRNSHLCHIYPTTEYEFPEVDLPDIGKYVIATSKSEAPYSLNVSVDPDSILTPSERQKFKDVLLKFDSVFNPQIDCYNGAKGPLKATVNMGPVPPPQRKGRLPQYSKDKLVELQAKFDELENIGVFKRPEAANTVVEYLNPSFLVKKPNGGSRLVTSFGDVARYSKPQPSLMPDVDTVLRTIGSWKYLIKSDLTKAFFQMQLSPDSLKYCGVATPFKGIRVYVRSAMGMPGSETALEELMCLVLGDLIAEGGVVKIADDLYCGANSVNELLVTWEKVLFELDKCNLKVSSPKTIICPKSTTVLGWIWNQGSLSASSHRISTLSNCSIPQNVKNLRSFIGAFKMLSRVLKDCSSLIDPLDQICAGQTSQSKITWSDELIQSFNKAQKSLSDTKQIVLPNRTDQLWIVTDGSVKQHGLGSTLYVTRNDRPRLAGFFSAKMKKHQINWLPCEVEALSIATSIKHFSPFIIQSDKRSCLLTDSKPCVQAFDKMCRGEFSASPRVTTFLSLVSRYQISIQHLKGTVNKPSDFQSRNAPDCNDPKCQICSFTAQLEIATVREVTVHDILSGNVRLPFANRSAWLETQHECSDMRRSTAHLKQGTRPSKKLTNIKDVKRYISISSISKDGLLIHKLDEPLAPVRECIIVPRHAIDGLLLALHIKFEHPTKHQLKQMFKRYFYTLDLDRVLETLYDNCHTCASLKNTPDMLLKQSSCDPPDAVGVSFAADVIKRYRQVILVLRETVTSFTVSQLLANEQKNTLRDALICGCLSLKASEGPPSVIRVDPAPGFMHLDGDLRLRELGLCVEVGRIKNKNKNPVAEHAVRELGDEILRLNPENNPISEATLAVATARLNSRIRNRGLSAREMFYQRDQFTNSQLPISDIDLIYQQHSARLHNHEHSEKSKSYNKTIPPESHIEIGDLVYLYQDRDKTKGRPRYLVIAVEGQWCNIRKFTGSQLRTSSYRVKRSECFKVSPQINSYDYIHSALETTSDDEEINENIIPPSPPEPPTIPVELTAPDVPAYEPILYDNDLLDSASDLCIDPAPSSLNPVSTSGPRRSTRIKKAPNRFNDFIKS